MQLKENLAALGELSAGIAHEFKNALATISGYAQLIQSENPSPEVADNADKILEQTRNITHVVTEFLRYAAPARYFPRTSRSQRDHRTRRLPKFRKRSRWSAFAPKAPSEKLPETMA